MCSFQKERIQQGKSDKEKVTGKSDREKVTGKKWQGKSDWEKVTATKWQQQSDSEKNSNRFDQGWINTVFGDCYFFLLL